MTIETPDDTPDTHELEGGLEGSTIKTIVDDDGPEEEAPAPKKVKEPKAKEEDPIAAEIKALRAEIAAMKKAAEPKPAPKQQAPEEEVNWEELFFSDPKTAARKIQEQVEKKLRAEYEEANQHQERRASVSKFWEDFKKENPDLADEDSMALVEAEMSKSWDYVKDLPFGEARQTLAERTRKRMLRMLKKDTAAPKEQRTLTEGSPVKTSTGGGDESPKVLSLSEVIKRKQALMKKGA